LRDCFERLPVECSIVFDGPYFPEETEQELNVIECCLPNTDEGTEPSDVEVMDDEIDLDELSGISRD
jgi:hypothetical protein